MGSEWSGPERGQGDRPPASERITMGCIGVGGRGRLNLNGLLPQGGHIAAAIIAARESPTRA